jgi:hypothetical protein
MVATTPDRTSGSARRQGALDPKAGLCAVLLCLPLAAGAQTPAAGGATGGASGGAAGGAAGAAAATGAAQPGGGGGGGAAASPATGPRASALRVGGLGFPVGAEPVAGPAPARAWTLRPSLGIELIATDNAFNSVRDRRADLITTVRPSLVASAQTARVTGAISYSPVVAYYAATGGQNRVDHFLNGQALVTLAPDWLFLDLRANSSVASLTGGLPAGGTVVTDRRNRVQTTSVQVSPYVQFRLPSIGTAQFGYAFQYVDQSAGGTGLGGGGGTTGGLAGGLGGTAFFAPGDYIAHEGFAQVATGEELGRLSLTGRVSATAYDGEGVLDGASRRIGVVESRYAITPAFAALVDLGYEQQRYAGPRPLDVDSPIWALGFALTGPDSSLTAKYGRRDGFESFSLDSSIAIGGRTRLAARYEERLTTTTLRAAQQLARAQFDAAGNAVDPVTGIPIAPGIADNLLAVQGGLIRTRTATAALTQTWPRDTVTLSLTRDERTPVNPAPGSAVFAQRGLTGGISYVRQIRPDLSGALFGQYGVAESPGRGDSETYSAGVSLSRDFGQGLSGTMQYRHSNRGDFSGANAVQNLVLLGLRKDFW